MPLILSGLDGLDLLLLCAALWILHGVWRAGSSLLPAQEE